MPALMADVTIEWSDYEPRYQELLQRNLTPENATQYLQDWSDLTAEIIEKSTILGVRADLNTAEKSIQDKYLTFVKETNPKISSADAAVKARLVALEGYAPPEDAVLILKRFKTESQIFREENLPLFAELAELSQQYSQITGNMLVDFRGEQITAPRVEQLLLEPDRELREEVWKAWQDARLRIAPQLDEVFMKQLALRQQVARNAGFQNHQEFIWKMYHRYDYTPADARQFQQSIEQEVVPFALELLEQHRQGLGVDSLKPWDFYWRSQMDPLARAPLNPFKTVDELETKIQKVFASLSPELGEQFELFRQEGAMDLGSRKNKMSHAYCAALPTRQLPFVLQNVVGMEGDVTVTLHEFGHAFHGYSSMKQNRFVWNGFSATEFVEVPSQGMECLAIPHLGAFYTPEEIQRVKEAQILRVVHILPWIAFMDSFQDWVYTQAPEDVTIEQIDAKCRELINRLQPQPSWAGFEAQQGKAWHYHHIFTSPFYYIEYGLSWLGALQLWHNSLQDPAGALEKYQASLALGDTRSVPELYEAAGLKFAFDRETIRDLMGFLREQM